MGRSVADTLAVGDEEEAAGDRVSGGMGSVLWDDELDKLTHPRVSNGSALPYNTDQLGRGISV